MGAIVVITTVYNSERYIEACVSSVLSQDLTNWRMFAVDDCSLDRTGDLLEGFRDSRLTVIHNAERRRQVANHYDVLHRAEIAADDICVTVDGDDWLPDPGVFDRVLAAYADGRTLVTWGSYVEHDGSGLHPGRFSTPVADVTKVRSEAWRTSHLRTFKALLFRKIHLEHLQRNGQFVKSAGDLGFMFPLLEMAGNTRAKFLPSVNYVYNSANPLCNFRVAQTYEIDDQYFRSLPPYPVLREVG